MFRRFRGLQAALSATREKLRPGSPPAGWRYSSPAGWGGSVRLPDGALTAEARYWSDPSGQPRHWSVPSGWPRVCSRQPGSFCPRRLGRGWWWHLPRPPPPPRPAPPPAAPCPGEGWPLAAQPSKQRRHALDKVKWWHFKCWGFVLSFSASGFTKRMPKKFLN